VEIPEPSEGIAAQSLAWATKRHSKLNRPCPRNALKIKANPSWVIAEKPIFNPKNQP